MWILHKCEFGKGGSLQINAKLVKEELKITIYSYRSYISGHLGHLVISTNQKPTIYRNLYENTAPDDWALIFHFQYNIIWLILFGRLEILGTTVHQSA